MEVRFTGVTSLTNYSNIRKSEQKILGCAVGNTLVLFLVFLKALCGLQKGRKVLSEMQCAAVSTLGPAGSLEEQLVLPAWQSSARVAVNWHEMAGKPGGSAGPQSWGCFGFPWLVCRSFTNGLSSCVPGTGRAFLVCLFVSLFFPVMSALCLDPELVTSSLHTSCLLSGKACPFRSAGEGAQWEQLTEEIQRSSFMYFRVV